jgi:pyruvate dehydrogenase E2 component (dihydrolipoamide acetyltransferase)
MATQVLVPVMGEAVGEARIGAWLKAAGDAVRRGDELAELETDKAVLMLECPADGVLLEILAPAGSMVATGQVLARLGTVEEAHGAAEAGASAGRGERPPADGPADGLVQVDGEEGSRLRVSPAARRMARGLGLDLEAMAAAKAPGRVTTEDVARALDEATAAAAKKRGGDGEDLDPLGLPAAGPGSLAGRRLPLTANQRVMAQRMAQSAREVPQFSLAMHVEAGRLLQVKEELAAKGAAGGMAVSLTALLVYLAGRVLLRHPLLNAQFDGDAVRVFETANMGVAVAAPGGLVVPVLHAVERLALGEIARRLRELSERARGGRLSPAEVSGGTFTLSNLGMYGVSTFVPLVNPPQSAILGVAAVEGVVVPSAGGTRHIQRMTLTLSADHRVVDGAAAAAFLQELRMAIEDATFG